MDANSRAPKRRRVGDVSPLSNAVPTAVMASTRSSSRHLLPASLTSADNTQQTHDGTITDPRSEAGTSYAQSSAVGNPELQAAQEQWKALKAKTYKRRKKPEPSAAQAPTPNHTEAVDVYDDFDGALTGASPYGKMPKPAARQQKSGGKGGSATINEETQSLVKPYYRSVAKFFKQFVGSDASNSVSDASEDEIASDQNTVGVEGAVARQSIGDLNRDHHLVEKNANVDASIEERRGEIASSLHFSSLETRNLAQSPNPLSTAVTLPPQKKRGRPKKNPEDLAKNNRPPAEPKKRGRPLKNPDQPAVKRRTPAKKVPDANSQQPATDPEGNLAVAEHEIRMEKDVVTKHRPNGTGSEELEGPDTFADTIEVSHTPVKKKRVFTKRTPKSASQPRLDASATQFISVPFPLTTPKRSNAQMDEMQNGAPVAQALEITTSTDIFEVDTLRVPANEVMSVFEQRDLELIQSVLLEKACGKRSIRLVNRHDEYVKVAALITQTIDTGESNSMLLIGSRGSGKSALIDQILREQHEKHPNEFHVVRLNGFIHTDDKIALRDIWRQLGRDIDGQDEGSISTTSTNYADTLTSLLALLSHRTEDNTDQPDLLTKSVVFILDEFELFATHPRQTLLYNLFDIAQSRKAPIAVVGLTTKIDVAETLEKRVKSRFSHRYVYLSQAKTFQSFVQICKNIMQITELEVKSQISADVVAGWNATMDNLLALESMHHHLCRLYSSTKSIPDFLSSIIAPVARLPTSGPCSAAEILEHFENNTILLFSYLPPDSRISLLNSLSALQLALLVCAARLTAIYNIDTVSFALAYDEYKSNASRAKLHASAAGALAQGAATKVWSKDVAHDAWHALLQCGLITVDGRAGGLGRVDIGLEEIGSSGIELGLWAKLCREI